MMRGKVPLRLSNCFWCRFVAPLIFLFFVMAPFPSQAGVVKGKVISIRGNLVELDLGIEKGIQLGDSGRVCYNILIQGKEKPIFIAKFKITHVSDKSSTAQVEEKTGEVKVGHLVEIIFKEGELELISNPSGGKIYVDGKERGETPSVVSNVRLGSHVIRIVKQGYEPYEEQVKVAEGERKKISASLRMGAGSLFVNTDPSGANIFIDGRSVGASPYEGRDLFSGTHRVKVAREGYGNWEQDVVVEAGKRVQVFAMLREIRKEVTLASPPAKAAPSKVVGMPKSPPKFDFSQKSCDAPIWNVGDRWNYKNVTGPFSYEIVESKEDVFLLKVTGNQPLRAYDKKTMNHLFSVGKDGQKTGNEENAFRKVLDFPIFVGKKWSNNIISSEGITYIVELKVEGIEEIVSDAGKFKTYKIFFKLTSMASFNSGWVRYWYSPEVKMWAKTEVEKTSFWAKTPWLQDCELISYKLK
jgi:hypothetical protein